MVDCTCLENKSPGNRTVSSNLTPSALMRYLGIDYGSKRVGVAISDEVGRFAMPYTVLPNTKNLADEIANICQKEGVSEIVIGKSLNYQNQPNQILAASEEFAESLKEKINLPIIWEPEFLTSQQAKHDIGKDEMHDARAAALILRSYLDRLYS